MNSSPSEIVLNEIEKWDRGLIDIETMTLRLKEVEKHCEVMKDKVKILEKRVKVKYSITEIYFSIIYIKKRVNVCRKKNTICFSF